MAQLLIGTAFVLFLAARKSMSVPKLNPNIHKIDEGLYLTCADNARDYKTLRELGVKQILTAGFELTPHSKSGPFELMHLKVDDAPKENLAKYFYSAHKFIEKNPTVVHCRMGISRSSTLVIAHLMIKYKLTAQEALQRVKAIRSQVDPNPGFIKQLEQLEKHIKS